MTEARPTREQALDGLAYMAALEHALVVDYLQIHCAVGGNVDPAPDSGDVGVNLARLAGAFDGLAQREMKHLRILNAALVTAGRGPVLDRATHVLAGDAAVPIASFRPEQFTDFPARERTIASALDHRYAPLHVAVEALNPPLDDPFGTLGSFLSSPSEHTSNLDGALSQLPSFDPGPHLRATRVEPDDDVERTLLAMSDEYYRALVGNVRALFRFPDVGGLDGRALSAMDVLSAVNDLAVERGLVPRFALTPG